MAFQLPLTCVQRRDRIVVRVLVLLLTVLMLGAGLSASGILNLPRVVGYVRVFSIENQPLPFVMHFIRMDKGEWPMCFMVLREENSGQFTTTEVHVSACDPATGL